MVRIKLRDIKKIVLTPYFGTFAAIVAIAATWGIIGMVNNNKINNSYLFDNNINEVCINDWCMKKNDIWQGEINGKKVTIDREKIDDLVEKMEKITLRTNAIVSVNKENFGSFGIDSKLVLKINGMAIEVGNLGRGLESTYIMTEEKVYVVPVVLNKEVMAKNDYWPNMQISKINSPDLKKVRISRNNKESLIEVSDGKADNQKLIDKLSDLRALNLLEEPKGLVSEKLSYKLEGNNNYYIEFSVGDWFKTRRERVFWIRDMTGNYFQIDKSDFDLLTSLAK